MPGAEGRGGRNTVCNGVDFLLLALGSLAGFLQNAGQRGLDGCAVTAALGADGGVFLVGVERAAGAEPAVLGILGHTGQLHIAGALLQSAGNGAGQHTGHIQAHALVVAQVNAAAIQERAILLDFDTGDRRVADIDGIVTAEHSTGLGVELLIVEVILAQDLTGGILTFEVDDQAGQRLGADIFKGQADGDLTGHVAFQQLNTHKLDRAAGRVIVSAGLRHQGKILIHSSHLLFTLACRAGCCPARLAAGFRSVRQAAQVLHFPAQVLRVWRFRPCRCHRAAGFHPPSGS